VKTLVRHSDECLAHIGTRSTASVTSGCGAHRHERAEAARSPERDVELAGIAGFMHDIGNGVNREGHAQIGAVMAMQL